MDEVTQAVENPKKEWSQAVVQLEECIAEIRLCGELGKVTQETNSLLRLNGDDQDMLKSFKLNLLVPQMPNCEEVQFSQASHGRSSIRNESASVLRKAESEYHVHHSLLVRTLCCDKTFLIGRCSTLCCDKTFLIGRCNRSFIGPCEAVTCFYDRWCVMCSKFVLEKTKTIILTIRFLTFTLATVYIVSKRIDLVRLEKKLAGAMKSSSINERHFGKGPGSTYATGCSSSSQRQSSHLR